MSGASIESEQWLSAFRRLEWVPATYAVKASDEGATVLLYAIDEALLCGHEYVGSEHLFAGAVRTSAAVVRSLGRLVPIREVIAEALRVSNRLVEITPADQIIICGKREDPQDLVWQRVQAAVAHQDMFPLTPRAERNIADAQALARQFGNGRFGAEEVVAAVSRDGGAVEKALTAFGSAREEAATFMLRRREWGSLLRLADESSDTPPQGLAGVDR